MALTAFAYQKNMVTFMIPGEELDIIDSGCEPHMLF